jgi:hypothetical protein
MSSHGDPKFNDSWVQSVVCSSPTTPAARDVVRFGYQTGIALTDESAGGNASGYTTVDCGPWTKYLSVKGVDANGNSAVAVGDTIYFVDADTPKLSKKATGYAFGVALGAVDSGATTVIPVWHWPNAGVGAAFPGAGDIVASMLSTTLKTGFIPLDITSLRIIATNAIGNTTEGMLLDGNTAPSLARVNGATDKALRVIWASSSSVEVQFPPVPKPPDLNGAANLTVHLLMQKDTNTDNAVTVDVQVFDGIGDTECGAETAALSTATLTEYSATVTASDLGDHPGFLNISLTPGAHTTDAIRLYAAWIEYERA